MTYLTFQGDVRDSIIGQIMGPDDNNGFSAAVEAEYFVLPNFTRVRFEPVNKDDEREVVFDEFDQIHLNGSVNDG